MKGEDLIIRVGKEITKFKVYKKVMVSGNGGIIIMPKDLVGKVVYVEYEVEE